MQPESRETIERLLFELNFSLQDLHDAKDNLHFDDLFMMQSCFEQLKSLMHSIQISRLKAIS